MKIGLFFGSFNPIHVGHLIIAQHFINFSDLKKIWFVVSPQNPLKNKQSLLNEYDRLHLVSLAISNNSNFQTSSIEFELPKPSYTIDTMAYLDEKYPQHQFVLLMGSDNLLSLKKWKNYETLVERYAIYVYKRQDVIGIVDFPNVKQFDFPLLHLSASYIRQCLKEKKSIKYLVTEVVEEELLKMNAYR